MQFEKNLQWKYYESWIYHDKLNDCVIHIYRINKAKNYKSGVFHFTIIKQSDSFSSLTNGMVYESLYECEGAVALWRIKNFDEKDEVVKKDKYTYLL